eukprot:3522539-Pleurochrysis_carterae.AAC.1
MRGYVNSFRCRVEAHEPWMVTGFAQVDAWRGLSCEFVRSQHDLWVDAAADGAKTPAHEGVWPVTLNHADS